MTWQLHSGSGAPGTLPGQTDGDNYIDCMNNTLYQLRTGTWYSIANFSPMMLPTGSVIPYSGVTVPVGYVWADGAAVSRSTYSNLYNVLTADKGNFTVSIASPAVVTLTGHGLATGDCVELTTTGALPTGLSVNTNYYIIYIDANTFNLATTYANALAGTKINTSGTQSGAHSLRYCPWGISGASNFLLPDSRGVFPKGAGSTTRAAGVDASGNAYAGTLGSYSQDKMQGHWHNLAGTGSQDGTGVNGTWTNYMMRDGKNDGTYSKDSEVQIPVTDGTNGTPRTGHTTEPQSLGLTFIIKL